MRVDVADARPARVFALPLAARLEPVMAAWRRAGLARPAPQRSDDRRAGRAPLGEVGDAVGARGGARDDLRAAAARARRGLPVAAHGAWVDAEQVGELVGGQAALKALSGLYTLAARERQRRRRPEAGGLQRGAPGAKARAHERVMRPAGMFAFPLVRAVDRESGGARGDRRPVIRARSAALFVGPSAQRGGDPLLRPFSAAAAAQPPRPRRARDLAAGAARRRHLTPSLDGKADGRSKLPSAHALWAGPDRHGLGGRDPAELARNSPESRRKSLTGFRATNSHHVRRGRSPCNCARSSDLGSAPERIRTSDLRFRRPTTRRPSMAS